MPSHDELRMAANHPNIIRVLKNLERDPDFRRAVTLPDDAEPIPSIPHVYRLRGDRAEQQNTPAEIEFATRVARLHSDTVVLVGKAPAIDGFLVSNGKTFQLKQLTGDPSLQGGGVIDAVKRARKTAAKRPVPWRGIRVYVEAPALPVAWITKRWNDPGRSQKIAAHDLDGTLDFIVIVFGQDGICELPLKEPKEP